MSAALEFPVYGIFIASSSSVMAAIIESLPRYSELLVLAKRSDVRRSLGFELDRYLSGRTADRNPEVPLTRVTDQAYLYYGKGAIVMNALKHLLGEETLNHALRNFIAYAEQGCHIPTDPATITGAAIRRAR